MKMNNWSLIADSHSVYEGVYRFPGGLSRSVLVKSADGGCVVFSPGRDLLQGAKELIGDAPLSLVAGNSFHNLGFQSWLEEFPNAKIYAAKGALRRLKRKTGLEFIDIAQAKLRFPEIEFLVVPQNRIGELWMKVNTEMRTIYVICDAFFNMKKLPKTLLYRIIGRVLRMGPGLEIGRLMGTFGYKNKKQFLEWLDNQFLDQNDWMLVPMHGEIRGDKNLRDELLALAKKRLS